MSTDAMQIINQNCAGIDIGNDKIFVATDDGVVKNFSTFTLEYEACITYLQSKAVSSVVMEATGIYRITFFEMLEEKGFTVYVVNGAHAKNLPGRKSDVMDCEWLRQLHSYGLLRSSFIPDKEIRVLRQYVRLREDHIRMGAQHIQHMQKALIQMNVRLTSVITHITGVSGLRIIRAILAGERNPEKLVNLCDNSILKLKRQDVINSLQGNYREEHVFALRQAVECWEMYQKQIDACDKQIDAIIQTFGKNPPDNLPNTPKKKTRKSNPYHIEGMSAKVMQMIGGKDLISVVGLNEASVLEIISEVGTDLSKWPTAKHFVTWMGLSPRKHQSGKGSKRVRAKFTNRAGEIFRLCARGIGRSKNTALRGFYHRIKAKKGAPVANKATARKLAVLFYDIMTKGVDYVEMGLQEYQEMYKAHQLKYLAKKARELGLELVIP